MCLYPRLLKNPKYQPNKKNGGKPERPDDPRQMYVAIGCGNCIECRQKAVRAWRLRIEWENRKNPIKGKFITLSFSEEALDKLPKEPNAAAARAVELFRKRWQKEKKKALRHWLIPELGKQGTERLHIHGIVWTTEATDIERIWGYGNVIIEPITDTTVEYITKYVQKPDEKHPEFRGKVLCSKGIGKAFENSETAKRYKREQAEAPQYIKLNDGQKIDIPIYYRNKLFTEETKAQIWSDLLDKKTRYVRGLKIDISTREGEIHYQKALLEAQRRNTELGYPKNPWSKKKYYETRKKIDENLEKWKI